MKRNPSTIRLRARPRGPVLAFVFIAVFSSGLVSAAADTKEVDWERALADYRQIKQTITDNAMWVQRAKPSPEQRAKHDAWVVARHAGTDLAANVEAGYVTALLAEQKLDQVAPSAMALVGKYPVSTAAHDIVLTATLRVISSTEIPDAARVAAFETMLPGFKDRALLLGRACRALRKLGIPAVERYELVKRAVEQCGNYPQSREAQWKALHDATADLGPARFAQECRAIASQFGEQNTVGREAHKAALQAAAKAGDTASAAELNKLEAEDNATAATVSAAFAEAVRLLAEGHGEQAAAALERLMSNVPAYATDEAWCALLRNRVLTDAPAAQAILIARVLVEQGPEGDAIDLGYGVLNKFRFQSSVAPVFVKLASRHAVDRQRSCQIAQTAVRLSSGNTDDSAVQLEAYRVAAEVARKLHAEDRRVRFLVGVGKHGWDIAPQEAREALRTAASYYPTIPDAAEAGWMLALLEGRLSVEQQPMPRPRNKDDEAPVRPNLDLPPGPPAAETVVVTAAGISLAVLDAKVDLLAGGTPAASDSPETAVHAVDAKTDTAWQPAQLPASLIMPLTSESSVARLRVAAENSLYFTVSLLDRQGQTLARVERDWGFWDHFRSKAYWPQPVEDLTILPTAGVCFVRLDVYRCEGQARVLSVEAYASPIEAQGAYLGKPTALARTSQSVQVNWQSEEPRRTVGYDASGEWARGFMNFRWNHFWTRSVRPLLLHKTGGNLGISFFGTNARLVLDKPGAVRWQIDDGPSNLIAHPGEDAEEHALTSSLAPGMHVLKVAEDAIPQQVNDGLSPRGTRFVRMDVDGVSRVRVAVRFGRRGGKWGPWSAPLVASGNTVQVPSELEGGPPELVQAGAFFDAREVRALESATVKKLEVVAQADVVKVVRETAKSSDRSLLAEELAAVVELLKRRAVVVTYPKAGTVAEYEAARRLADKAGAYLVSDDIGLNRSNGLVLAVGTPHRHRYVRQLLATEGLWNSPAFFADKDGTITVVRGMSGEPLMAAAIGETPEAAVRAAERILAALPVHAAPEKPLRVFASNTLEDINAWQFHTDRPTLTEVGIRLAAGDRRSAQIGLSANRAISKLTISLTEPIDEQGRKLPKPIVRPVGFYEWLPFFGDLRLPNLLLESATVSMPANASRGLWVTVVTPHDTKPGVYHAELTLNADGVSTRTPITIKIEPIELAPQSKAATYSFAYLPYSFHAGTPNWERALRALAANEASHGATHVGIGLSFTWQSQPPKAPGGEATAKLDFKFVDRQMDIFEQEYKKFGLVPKFLVQTSADLTALGGDLFGSANDSRTAQIFGVQFHDHLERLGRLDRTLFKVADEPSDIAQWTAKAIDYQKAGLHTMTCHSGNYPNIETAVGVMNPWCPNYQHDVLRPFFKERQQAGDQVWWYCCGVPVTRLTGTPTENLPFYWLTAKWGFDGAMNFSTMHANDEVMHAPFRYEHGMFHRIVLLPDGALLDTPRRELETEGINDLKLIEFVRAATDTLGSRDPVKAKAIRDELEKVIASIVPYKYGYSSNPQAWLSARDQIYDLAVRTATTGK